MSIIKDRGIRAIIYILLLVMGLASLMPLYWVFSTAFQLPAYQNEEMKEPISYVESVPPKLYPVGIKEYYSQWQKMKEAEKTGDIADAQYHRDKMSEVKKLTFSSFVTLFTKTKILRWLFNSFYISITVTMGVVFIDTMAGYVLAKKRFAGRKAIFWLIVSTMMVPEQVTLVPTFIMAQKLNLFDTHWALILPSFAIKKVDMRK